MQHDWVKSTLGHGETMCSRCFITNREAAVIGASEICNVPTPPPHADNDHGQSMDEAAAANFGLTIDDLDEAGDDVCPNCGGEGVVYNCQDEIGCVDPEDGCDLCERPCDWCRPRRSHKDNEGSHG